MGSKDQICIVHQFEKCEKQNKCNYAHAICEYDPPECKCKVDDCPLKHKIPNTEILPYNIAQLNVLHQDRKRCSFYICPNIINGESCTTKHCQYAHNDHELNFKLCDRIMCDCFDKHDHEENSKSYFSRILRAYQSVNFKTIKVEVADTDITNLANDLKKIGATLDYV